MLVTPCSCSAPTRTFREAEPNGTTTRTRSWLKGWCFYTVPWRMLFMDHRITLGLSLVHCLSLVPSGSTCWSLARFLPITMMTSETGQREWV